MRNLILIILLTIFFYSCTKTDTIVQPTHEIDTVIIIDTNRHLEQWQLIYANDKPMPNSWNYDSLDLTNTDTFKVTFNYTCNDLTQGEFKLILNMANTPIDTFIYGSGIYEKNIKILPQFKQRIGISYISYARAPYFFICNALKLYKPLK